MKKIIILGLLIGALSSTVHAYHYIYLKNSLVPTTIVVNGASQQVGPATIKQAQIVDSNGNPPDSDQYDSTIDPGKTSYGYSSDSDTWNLTLNVQPSNSREQQLSSSVMRPVLLQQSDDIEVVYIQPTTSDPNTYYGYIVYSEGDRFEGPNGTNTGDASSPQPFLQQDGVTKFPVIPAPQAQASSTTTSTSSIGSSSSSSSPFAGMALPDAINALEGAIQADTSDSILAGYIKEFLQQYGIQLEASGNQDYINLYNVLNAQLKALKS